MLRQELGEPIHSWQWSEHLTVSMATGKYNPTADPNSGLIVMQPEFKLRPMLIFHRFRWTLCQFAWTPYEEWLRTGLASKQEYARNGYWQPLGTPKCPAVLDINEAPDKDLTWQAIYAVREDRSHTLADFKNDMESRMEKAEKYKRGRMYDRIRDAMTTYGTIPGRRTHVSFPSVVRPS